MGFDVAEGAIKAVIGPNGAGKTTLFNLVFGSIVPDKGSVNFAGTRLAAGRPHRQVAAGVLPSGTICEISKCFEL